MHSQESKVYIFHGTHNYDISRATSRKNTSSLRSRFQQGVIAEILLSLFKKEDQVHSSSIISGRVTPEPALSSSGLGYFAMATAAMSTVTASVALAGLSAFNDRLIKKGIYANPQLHDSDDICTIEGCDVLGNNKDDILAVSLLQILQDIVSGKKNLIVEGYSRGACIALAACQFLQKLTYSDNIQEMKEIFTNQYQSRHLDALIQYVNEHKAEIERNLTEVEINLKLHDPVPGGASYLGSLFPANWLHQSQVKDTLLTIPSIVTAADITLSTDQGHCFAPVLPMFTEQGKVARVRILPGNHCTMEGGRVLPNLSVEDKRLSYSERNLLLVEDIFDMLDLGLELKEGWGVIFDSLDLGEDVTSNLVAAISSYMDCDSTQGKEQIKSRILGELRDKVEAAEGILRRACLEGGTASRTQYFSWLERPIYVLDKEELKQLDSAFLRQALYEGFGATSAAELARESLFSCLEIEATDPRIFHRIVDRALNIQRSRSTREVLTDTLANAPQKTLSVLRGAMNERQAKAAVSPQPAEALSTDAVTVSPARPS